MSDLKIPDNSRPLMDTEAIFINPPPPCKRCGSSDINPRQHGRKPNENLHLCDVCYWRVKAEKYRDKIHRLEMELNRPQWEAFDKTLKEAFDATNGHVSGQDDSRKIHKT